MDTVLQFILDLFRDENAAQAFVANPNAALADAGLADVIPQQLRSVAATAVPGSSWPPRRTRSPDCSRRCPTSSASRRWNPCCPRSAPGSSPTRPRRSASTAAPRSRAALGDGIGAGLGAGLEGGAELAGQTAVGLGTGLGLGPRWRR